MRSTTVEKVWRSVILSLFLIAILWGCLKWIVPAVMELCKH